MDNKEAIILFENNTKKHVVQIERCGVGIANYVFIVSTAMEKYILRCSKEEDAYKDTVNLLGRLSACEIPIPAVLSYGKYGDYSYLILSYMPGDDIGNVYYSLNSSEKKQIAREVVEIQRKVSMIDISTDSEWTWNRMRSLSFLWKNGTNAVNGWFHNPGQSTAPQSFEKSRSCDRFLSEITVHGETPFSWAIISPAPIFLPVPGFHNFRSCWFQL